MSTTTDIERPYDGCGKCLVGLRRLSRSSDASSSPAKQRDQVLQVVRAYGGHVIAWADDWEVSGATDPKTRPRLGPWLRGERGPYSGIAGASVDRLGRNVVDCLNTGYMMRDHGLTLLTYGHDGPWDLDDPHDENRFTMEAWGAQMELRSVQRRNRESAVKARRDGKIKYKPSYGYRYERDLPTGPVSRAILDDGATLPAPWNEEDAAEIIRNVARRILVDQTGEITENTEAARLTREGLLSPEDRKRVLYGRKPQVSPWPGASLARILMSKSALGYLIHKDEPVLDEATGKPIRIGPELWNYATHRALVKKLTPKGKRRIRSANNAYLLTKRIVCGNCHNRMYVARGRSKNAWACRSKFKGLTDCAPAPNIRMEEIDALVEGWFLEEFGSGMIMETVYVPGNGVADLVEEVEATRARLRSDREAGLYDSADDQEWFRSRYASLGRELEGLRQQPETTGGMVRRPTGKTIEDAWHEAADDAGRREILAGFGVVISVWPDSSPVRWYPGRMHGPERNSEQPTTTELLPALSSMENAVAA
ncbi:recombinase family protein [Streptomyces natalensis]|uniref:recombinase family protein n=1 Tax=Streptomyces natalensis TaxID=68242 RepID=UPI0005C9A8DB|nr:recombinase family protein [Streptomyces natalensis]